jgi:hypothetical protein
MHRFGDRKSQPILIVAGSIVDYSDDALFEINRLDPGARLRSG